MYGGQESGQTQNTREKLRYTLPSRPNPKHVQTKSEEFETDVLSFSKVAGQKKTG